MTQIEKQIICLTFDIDWAEDFIIFDALNLLGKFGVKATFFATHQSAILKEIDSKDYEVALHPNFNSLLTGGGGHFADTINKLQNLYPDSVGIRSHSLVQGGTILQHLMENNFLLSNFSN